MYRGHVGSSGSVMRKIHLNDEEALRDPKTLHYFAKNKRFGVNPWSAVNSFLCLERDWIKF